MRKWPRFAFSQSFIKYGKWLLLFLLFYILISSYFTNLKTHRFHIDEYEFIRKSYYFDLFFVKRDLSDPRWYRYDAPAQPKVGPYIYGAALHLAGISDIENNLQSLGFSQFSVEGEVWWKKFWWQKLDHLPAGLPPILHPVWLGRNVAVLFSLGALLLLFLLAAKIRGFLFGWVAVFLLGTNSLMFDYGRRAMTDSMQLFFFLANLLLAFFFSKALKGKDSKNIFLLSVALGLNLALGVGVKISGILSLLFLAALFSLLLILQRHSRKMIRLTIFGSLTLGITFASVFTILHPYLYRNPLPQFVSMFTSRMEGESNYQLVYPGTAVASRWQAVTTIVKRTLVAKTGYTNFSLSWFPLDLFLFVTGFWFMAKTATKKLTLSRKISGELILLLWTVIVITSLALYLHSDWPRYYLPIVAAITITEAYGIVYSLNVLRSAFKI